MLTLHAIVLQLLLWKNFEVLGFKRILRVLIYFSQNKHDEKSIFFAVISISHSNLQLHFCLVQQNLKKSTCSFIVNF